MQQTAEENVSPRARKEAVRGMFEVIGEEVGGKVGRMIGGDFGEKVGEFLGRVAGRFLDGIGGTVSRVLNWF